MEYSKELVIEEVKKINSKKQFSKYVNEREYELDVTKLAKGITIKKEVFEELTEVIKNSLKKYNSKNIDDENEKFDDEDRNFAFTMYFVLFTICRRQKFGDILNLVTEYRETFEDYHMMEHIDLMAQLDRTSHPSSLFRAIQRSGKFLQLKSETEGYDFGEHVGALNVFCGLVCKYFETKLDEKDDSDKAKLINQAHACIIKAINLDKKRDANQSKSAYAKFYLNRGRVLILKGKYTQGEDDIHLAISCLDTSDDRVTTVNEYNQYLLKASIIRAYDLNEQKIHDLDKIKVSNYKSIALMTTLLGFILGAINVFAKVDEPFTLAMLMICYSGTLLALLGIILFGLSMTLKERKAKLLVYDCVLIVLGIIIFAVGIWIVLNA